MSRPLSPRLESHGGILCTHSFHIVITITSELLYVKPRHLLTYWVSSNRLSNFALRVTYATSRICILLVQLKSCHCDFWSRDMEKRFLSQSVTSTPARLRITSTLVIYSMDRTTIVTGFISLRHCTYWKDQDSLFGWCLIFIHSWQHIRSIFHGNCGDFHVLVILSR